MVGENGKKKLPFQSKEDIERFCSPEIKILDRELCLYDTCGLNSGSQYILFIGKIAGSGDPVQLIKIATEE